MNKTKLKTSLFIVSSFLIPAIMMFFIYLSQGIYWNSDTSPLLGDGYHQYVILIPHFEIFYMGQIAYFTVFKVD